MDDLDPKDDDIKKGKHLDDDDDLGFPDNDADDDFLDEKFSKKKLPLEDDEDSLDKLADDELDELDEPYDDFDPF